MSKMNKKHQKKMHQGDTILFTEIYDRVSIKVMKAGLQWLSLDLVILRILIYQDQKFHKLYGIMATYIELKRSTKHKIALENFNFMWIHLYLRYIKV